MVSNEKLFNFAFYLFKIVQAQCTAPKRGAATIPSNLPAAVHRVQARCSTSFRTASRHGAPRLGALQKIPNISNLTTIESSVNSIKFAVTFLGLLSR